ncbi:MAG TPA: sugar phosphate isomerase/epimerase family protein [Tepidisphaeraceae bacterium]|nr:sugar phosphate isomerase/epimerase family protein [Tepidisphaeraceae bacterium]
MYVCLNRGTAGGNLGTEPFTDLAAAAGFQGADVDLGYGVQHGAAKLADLFAARHLRFGGWGLPDWRGDDAAWQEGLGGLGAVADVAAALKIDSCATWLMPASDLPFMENWAFHVRRLKPMAQVLADRGLRLGLEFVAPYHLRAAKPHAFVFTPAQMLELADAVGPNAGLLVDCFHVHAAGEPWDAVARLPGDRIVLAHVNDCPNVPLGQVQDGERLLPGEGVIDLPAFFAALKATGYAGPVSLEVFNADLRALPAEQAAKRAWAATSRVLAAAGM